METADRGTEPRPKLNSIREWVVSIVVTLALVLPLLCLSRALSPREPPTHVEMCDWFEEHRSGLERVVGMASKDPSFAIHRHWFETPRPRSRIGLDDERLSAYMAQLESLDIWTCLSEQEGPIGVHFEVFIDGWIDDEIVRGIAFVPESDDLEKFTQQYDLAGWYVEIESPWYVYGSDYDD